jgi:NAD-dependent SIR2 family protein deacetylase
MANGNGDYLSRFERVEKTLEAITGRLDALTGRLDTLTDDVIKMHGTMKGLKENTDQLVGAIRGLIDRIPPENLR